jgi:Flp pilus assembly pilin Flp
MTRNPAYVVSGLRSAKSCDVLPNRFVRSEVGEDLIEYGLLLAFMATVALAVIIADPLSLQVALTDAYQSYVDALNAF